MRIQGSTQGTRSVELPTEGSNILVSKPRCREPVEASEGRYLSGLSLSSVVQRFIIGKFGPNGAVYPGRWFTGFCFFSFSFTFE